MCNTINFEYFKNTAQFIPEEKQINLSIDLSKETETISLLTDHYYDKDEILSNSNSPKNEQYFSILKSKYNIFVREREDIYEFVLENQCTTDYRIQNNVLSGSFITLDYGQGLLDFIYADFANPHIHINEDITQPNDNAQEYDLFKNTMQLLSDILYQSVYTAICPPVFLSQSAPRLMIENYIKYLIDLQQSYLDLLEFCFDKDFYPEILSSLYPSERYYLYRTLHNQPTILSRKENFTFTTLNGVGEKMPYGLPKKEVFERAFSNRVETDAEYDFAQKYNYYPDELVAILKAPHFITTQYEFGTVHDMLELEFTKLFEKDMHFRKCKRCGRYFIMKGNYDTNYCDRIADGETRNCQELSAQENYKAKIADNQAIPLYSKFYKRYSARVKASQIKETDFKKWKYQALTKRDECSDGVISIEEYEKWLTDSFPNRTPKK